MGKVALSTSLTQYRSLTHFEYGVRIGFSFLVNAVCLDLTLILLPLLLADSSTPLEFVQNAVAVCFVVALDDCSEKCYIIEEETAVQEAQVLDPLQAVMLSQSQKEALEEIINRELSQRNAAT